MQLNDHTTFATSNRHTINPKDQTHFSELKSRISRIIPIPEYLVTKQLEIIQQVNKSVKVIQIVLTKGSRE